MYDIIKLNDDTVHYYEFDNLVELVNCASESPINFRVFPSGNLSSEAVDNNGWYQTASFSEACDMCLCGDENLLNLFELKNKDASMMFSLLSTKRTLVSDYYGHRPNVGAYMSSRPKSMYRLVRKDNYEVIEIYYNVSSSCGVRAEQMLNKGIVTINLIRMLENLGYRVKLNFFELSYEKASWWDDYGSREYFFSVVNIKRADEKLDPSICCFPMCHPSFLRRILFRLKEVSKFEYFSWKATYGRCMSLFDTKRFLEAIGKQNLDKCIVISDLERVHDEYEKSVIAGVDLFDDMKRFLDFINIEQYIKEYSINANDKERTFSLVKTK